MLGSSVMESAVHDLYRWRGTIVGALAQFETVLLDLCIELNAHQDYAGLLEKYPNDADEMIAFMEKIMKLPGLISPMANVLTKDFREYEILRSDRNLFAHGVMRINHTAGVPSSLTVHLWHRQRPGRGAVRRTENILWSDFENKADKIAAFADRATASLTAIYSFFGVGKSTVTSYYP